MGSVHVSKKQISATPSNSDSVPVEKVVAGT